MWIRRMRPDWRLLGAVALVVVAACLAAALVPHTVGEFGDDVVVTDPGPPPSVDATLSNPRQRFQNRLTNRLIAIFPVLLPSSAAVVAFFVGRRPTESRSGESDGERVPSPLLGVVLGAFAGSAVGYAVFVGVASLAYGAVPSGYVLESYPPTLHAGALVWNALALAVATGGGAVLSGVAGRLTGKSDVS